MTIRAACFDLDGCLVDSRHAIATAINHALQAIGIATRPVEELHPLIGPPLLASFQQLITAAGADPSLATKAIDAYRSVYPELAMTETPVFDGIPEVLTSLGAGMPLAVVTSKPRAYAKPIVEAVGLGEHFVDVFGPELHALDEPKAAKLRVALDTLGMTQTPRSVAMIGDRLYDVDAGRTCGTVTVGVLWGIGSEQELREAGADHLVAEPSQIPDALGQPPM